MAFTIKLSWSSTDNYHVALALKQTSRERLEQRLSMLCLRSAIIPLYANLRNDRDIRTNSRFL